MIRAERGALLRAVTAEALREADREVVRTPLTRRSDVRFRGQTGKHFPILSCTGFDPNRTMQALICCAAQTTCCRARLTGVPPREGQVRRRRATSRKPAKAQQKTKAKRGTASKPARNRHVTALRKDTKIARLARELAEGREQQAATSELLKVFVRSTLDLQPVFETLAENAVRLCEAKRSFIYRFDGQYLRVVATHNASPELRAFVEQNPIAPGRGSATARAALERRTVQVLDAQGDPEYTYGSRQADPFRTISTVPILKGNELFGAIGIYRHEVRAFTESQISLLETFADQAVIAIENVRLFDETRDALERQTATAEILRVISSSPADTQPVFEAIVQSGLRLFANAGIMIALPSGRRPGAGRSCRRFGAGGCRSHPAAFPDSAHTRVHDWDRHSRSQGGGHFRRRERSLGPCDRSAQLSRDRLSGDYHRAHDAWRRRHRRTQCVATPAWAALGHAACTVKDLRRTGRHCHRECPPVERAARIAAAADGHRRRAQGHQPLDLRSPNSPRHAGGVGRKTVRGRYCGDASPTGLELSGGRDLRRSE